MTIKYQHGRLGRWIRLRGLQPVARAVMVVSAVAVLTTGVTYAALQSQTASLTGNSITTATADLRIGTTASTFSNTRTGFSFSSVVPGVVPAPNDGNSFYLKDYSAAPMALKVSIGTIPTNMSNVDLSKVYFGINRVDTSASQKFSLASLIAANATGGLSLADSLNGGASAQYKLQVMMDDDAFSGTTAGIGGIDLVFTGAVISAQ